MKRLLLLVLAVATSGAHANLSVGVGAAYFPTTINGVWYQNEYPHKVDKTAPTFTLRYDLNDWSVGYNYAGRVKSDALAQGSDQAYAAHLTTAQYPLSRWIGLGDTQSIFLTRRFNWQAYYATAGIQVSQCRFTMTIPDWIGATDPPANLTPGQPQFLQIHHNPRFYYPRPTLGVGYRFADSWALEVNSQPAPCGRDEWPPTWKPGVWSMSVIKSF